MANRSGMCKSDICSRQTRASASTRDHRRKSLIDWFKQFCHQHCERNLLAFVNGYLGEHGLQRVPTDADKYLLFVAFNHIESIAFVGDWHCRRKPRH